MKNKTNKIEQKLRISFNKGCVEYGLLEEGDRILVGLSGGKDSLLLLKLLAERSRIFKPAFKIEAIHIVMDNIPYEINSNFIEEFCRENKIRLHILHTSFDETTDHRKTKCFLCSWNRRKAIFTFAKENQFNKVALGHHQDDFITTLLMNMSFEGAFAAMSPKTKMSHYPIEIIRPLCKVAENDIEEYALEEEWKGQKKNCPFEEVTQRKQISQIAKELLNIHPEIRHNLWKSMQNVQKDRLPDKKGRK